MLSLGSALLWGETDFGFCGHQPSPISSPCCNTFHDLEDLGYDLSTCLASGRGELGDGGLCTRVCVLSVSRPDLHRLETVFTFWVPKMRQIWTFRNTLTYMSSEPPTHPFYQDLPRCDHGGSISAPLLLFYP